MTGESGHRDGARRIFAGAVYTFGSRLFSGGLRYATGIAIARTFGAEVFGQFAVGSVLLLFLVSIAAGGATSGLMGRVAERLETGGLSSAGHVIRRCRNQTWILGVALGLILVAVQHSGLSILEAAGNGAAVLGIAISVPLLGVTNVLESGTRGLKTTRYEVFLRCFVQPLLFLSILLAGRSRSAPSHFVWFAFAGSLAVELVLAEVFVARLFPKERATIEREPIDLWRYVGYDLVVIVAGSVDLWLVGLLATRVEVGYYGAAVKTVDVVVVLLGSFQMLLVPTFAGMIAAGRGDELRRLADTMARLMFLLSLAVALPLAFGARDVLGLYKGFEAGAPAMVVLVIVPALTSLCAPGGGILLIRNPERLARIRLAGAAVTCVVLLFLWPRLGLMGAAVASGAGWLTFNGLVLGAVPEARSFLTEPGVFGEVFVLLVAGIGVEWGVFTAAREFPPLARLALLAGASCASLGAVWLLLPGSTREREELRRLLGRPS